MTDDLTGVIAIAILAFMLGSAWAYTAGWRFKKVSWNWTSCCFGLHAGRNPVSGKRFAYFGLGLFLGLDFDKKGSTHEHA